MKRDGQGQRCMERDRDLVFVVSIHRPFDLIAGINNIVIIIINIKGGGHFGQGPKTINCVPLKCSPNLVVKIMAKNLLWTKKSFQKILFYELE